VSAGFAPSISIKPRVNPVQAQVRPTKPMPDVAGLQITTRINETSRGDALQRLEHTRDEGEGVLALLPGPALALILRRDDPFYTHRV
jgi:hypothetical protein